MTTTTKARAPEIFGTDGIRGLAGVGYLSEDHVETLGLVLATLYARPDETAWSESEAVARAALVRDALAMPSGRVVIGRDTRPSGPGLAAALTRGLVAGGAEVIELGVLPTPALAAALIELSAAAGAMISASHNPAADNGIKVFSGRAEKVPELVEVAIEDVLLGRRPRPAPASRVGHVDDRSAQARDIYARRLHAHTEALADRRPDLRGLRVVVDCAEGALSGFARSLLEDLGADVQAIHAQGRGEAINEGSGALHPESLAARVRASGAQIGAAFDGDADRVILVDAEGCIHHGDAILYVLAADLVARGRLVGGAVVGTVMSNLGLETALDALGLRLLRTPVGDRWVTRRMQEDGLVLGGEQAGHIAIAATPPLTGDGLLAALHVMNVMSTRQKSLAELTRGLVLFPQVLINVALARRRPIEELVALGEEARAAEAALGTTGRVLLRWSGTEPKLRVMVEALDAGMAKSWATRLAAAARRDDA